MSNAPLLVVLSGPSGVGKDSILQRMREQGLPFHFTVTATTRPPRAGERDEIDYFFYTEDEFQALVAADGFLEHAAVYGHHYGVPKAPVLEALARGRDVIMRTDVQGAATIRSQAPGAILIFVAPPSEESLMERLRRRDADSAADVALRLGKVQEEMAALPRFDYVVINGEGELDSCVARIEAIVRAEKCRVSRRPDWREKHPSGEPSTTVGGDPRKESEGLRMNDGGKECSEFLDVEIERLSEGLAYLSADWEIDPDPSMMNACVRSHETVMAALAVWRAGRLKELGSGAEFGRR